MYILPTLTYLEVGGPAGASEIFVFEPFNYEPIGGGGVGLVLRSSSARLDVRQACQLDLQRFLALSDYEGRLPQDATALHANFCPPKRTVCHYDMSCRRALHD